MFILYRISDFLAWLASDVISYRNAVIDENLSKSFPEKNDAELKRIKKEFYRSFADIIIESFKLLSLNPRVLEKRVRLINPEVLNRLKENNKGFIAVAGHYNNWEWLGVSLAPMLKMKSIVTYKPLSSNLMDKVMRKVRESYGTGMVTMKNTYRAVINNEEPIAALLVADQAPDPRTAYWNRFLHQDTPWFVGPEKISRTQNIPLVYFTFEREKRGYYTLEIKVLDLNPKESNPGELTELHSRCLEEQIIHHPASWLWSHKRWKHQRNV